MVGFNISEMNEILITENISKHYKEFCAVNALSLTVRRGEIYGFLGLNGAGKTTTIRMMLGMIKPSSGRVLMKGQEVSEANHAIWKNVGYLVEVPYAYTNLTVKENLQIIAKLRGLNGTEAVESVIKKLSLQKCANVQAGNLSLGNSQRLGLAKALIHQPEILILDEPSNGLDPAGIHEIRELLCDLAFKKGVTIFISSHILDEVARFATRIGIIHGGKLMQEIHTKQLEELSRKRLLLRTANDQAFAEIMQSAGYTVHKTESGLMECTDEHAIGNPSGIAELLVQKGLPPSHLEVRKENLEAYFLRTINAGIL